jgi:hypothetical protein
MEIKKINNLDEAVSLRNENNLIGLFDMSDEIYFSPKLRAINQSGLLKMRQSPAHYKAHTEEERKETAALRFGKMFHCAILEPEKFRDMYVTLNEPINARTKEGKQLLADFEAQNQGKIIIKIEEKEQLLNMQKAVYEHPYITKLLSGGYSELSCFWIDNITNVLCKCKFDYFNPQFDFIVDLKTTEDASEFSLSAAKYNYHVQNAFYIDGARNFLDINVTMLFIPVEKSKPHGVKICSISPYDIQNGREIYRHYLDKFSECLSTDNWPCYPQSTELIELPHWAYKMN